MAESIAKGKKRALEIVAILREVFPDARCSLDFRNPFELLVATILAAQCTDERVNSITPAVFAAWPDARALAHADAAEVESVIRPTGFFRNKTRSLLGMAAALVETHAGQVPEEMDELAALPGVGRKTANVLRGCAFGKPAIIVDTHCRRVAGRLGLTGNTDPDKIEGDLVAIIPPEERTRFSHLMVFHGRNICKAQRPLCGACPVNRLCPWPDKTSGAARA